MERIEVSVGFFYLGNTTRGRITYEGTKENVDNADEDLCAQKTLPKVHRVPHLSQEGDKEQGTSPAVCYRGLASSAYSQRETEQVLHTNHLVDAVQLSSKSYCRRLVSVRWRARESLDRADVMDACGESGCLVVDREIGRCYHAMPLLA